MAYALRYIMQFTSDRGNDIRIEILQKDYTGAAENKSLGGAPVLAIEEGDGAIKGSSLSFAIQADVEGELKGLYTTDNKTFKVNLYKNSKIYWQGYILPELYSETYIDAPYDVSVTATDQLATLKNVTYDQGDGQKTLYEIVTHILALTQIVLPVKIHMNLSVGENLPFLENSYVDTYAYIGQPCYDVLNTILTSCNACILQIDNQWLIQSLTDTSDAYRLDGVAERIEHTRIGQMGVEKVYPEGTMTMVNDPALKGVRLDYSHILRNSFLKNASCTSKEYWQFNPSEIIEEYCPRVVTSLLDGVTYRLYYWQLPQTDVKNGNGLQLWQEIDVKADSNYKCQISVDYLFGYSAEMLLLALVFDGDDGIRRRLTARGWEQVTDISDINNYIQITGESKGALFYKDVSNYSNYETAKILFNLPEVDGKLRVGFINTLVEGPPVSPPILYEFGLYIYVTNVFLTYENITGKTSTTVVEENATQEQVEDVIAYGDKISATNEALVGLNTLRNSAMIPLSQYTLSSSADTKTFESYFLAMLQEKSRYYGVKKMLLQGTIMGDNILAGLYLDTFSDKVMRMVSCQYDLLQDTMSVSLEEVPDTFVEYNEEVYATDNKAPSTSTSGTPSSVVSSGSSYLGLQGDGDVFVKDNRALVGKEARFDSYAIPIIPPEEISQERSYIYSSEPKVYPSIDLSQTLNRIKTLEDLGLTLEGNETDGFYIKSKYTFVSEAEISSFGLGTEGDGTGGVTALAALDDVNVSNPTDGQSLVYDLASGKWVNKTVSGGISEVTIKLGTASYDSVNGVVALPAYPTTLKNPYALTWSGHSSGSYDGSSAVNIAIPTSLPASDVYSWAKAASKPTYTFSEITSKPTTLAGYGITDALSVNGGVLTRTSAPIGFDYVVGSSHKASIKYNSDNNVSGLMMVNRLANTFLVLEDAGTLTYGSATSRNTLLHSGNYSSYALPLSGGIINGNLQIGVENNTSFNYLQLIRSSHYVRINNTDTNAVFSFGSYANNTATDEKALWIGDNGLRYVVDNTTIYDIIHSGNIGSQSVNYANSAGNADTLDGYHISNLYLASLIYSKEDLNNYKTSGVYGTGDNTPNQPIYHGGSLYVHSYGTYGTSYRTQIFSTLFSNQWYARTYLGSWRNWREFAFTDSNVASATKLQTARTIWGQSFDGTGNVYGAITTSTSQSNFNTIYTIHHRAALLFCEDLEPGHNLQIGIGRADNTLNMGYIGFYYSSSGSQNNFMSIGLWGHDNILNITGSDNVLIGTTTDIGAKLYVAGDIVATGEVSSGSDVRYKAIQSYVDIDIETIAKAPIINFKWNDREDDKVHLGSTAQYWYGTSLCNGVTPTDDEKLWTMGYGQIALASVVSVAKKVVNHEERLQIVEKELADCKAENKELKLERYGIQ